MTTRQTTSHGVTYTEHLDLDTAQNGTEPPFEHWEGDHTALVHVLWSAKHDGLMAPRPGNDLPLRRAIFDRLFGDHRLPFSDGLLDDLRAIIDAHDPDVTPDAPGARRLERDEVVERGNDATDVVATMLHRSRWLAAHTADKIARETKPDQAGADLSAITAAFNECFRGDFGGVDWRDDAAVQDFAHVVAPILARHNPTQS